MPKSIFVRKKKYRAEIRGLFRINLVDLVTQLRYISLIIFFPPSFGLIVETTQKDLDYQQKNSTEPCDVIVEAIKSFLW